MKGKQTPAPERAGTTASRADDLARFILREIGDDPELLLVMRRVIAMVAERYREDLRPPD